MTHVDQAYDYEVQLALAALGGLRLPAVGGRWGIPPPSPPRSKFKGEEPAAGSGKKRETGKRRARTAQSPAANGTQGEVHHSNGARTRTASPKIRFQKSSAGPLTGDFKDF